MPQRIIPKCDIDTVYFRFWGGPRRVHSVACPIKQTPHYRFAEAMLANLANDSDELPQGTGYGRYTRWETHCFGAPVDHSPEIYAAKIREWNTAQFDLINNPLAVCEFQNGYFLTDGAHRAAFAAAKGIRLVTVAIAPDPGWPAITGVGTIEKYSGAYRTM